MRVAVTTMVYNEEHDLKMWLRYYGGQFGEESLYVIDHGTTNGSTDAMGKANRIRIPRDKFDEMQRCAFCADVQHALLRYFDVVIRTDCDEFIVPDPDKHKDLAAYVAAMESDFAAPVGLDLIHFKDLEPPIDLERPILSQRKYCRFASAYCKPAISRVPLRWAVGFHACDKPLVIDTNLYLFHLKLMDHDLAMRRLHIWRNEVNWSDAALAAGHSRQTRLDDAPFEQEHFGIPRDLLTKDGIAPFEFGQMVHRIESLQYKVGPFYIADYFAGGISTVPERFQRLL